MPKISKDFLVKLSIAVLVIFLAVIGWVLFREGTTPEEGIQGEEETLEELLERLTPKDAQPLAEEEIRNLEELLKELTPDQPNQMTEQEQREMEELLKQLTP